MGFRRCEESHHITKDSKLPEEGYASKYRILETSDFSILLIICPN